MTGGVQWRIADPSSIVRLRNDGPTGTPRRFHAYRRSAALCEPGLLLGGSFSEFTPGDPFCAMCASLAGGGPS